MPAVLDYEMEFRQGRLQRGCDGNDEFMDSELSLDWNKRFTHDPFCFVSFSTCNTKVPHKFSQKIFWSQTKGPIHSTIYITLEL
jgi:hypothetical protein